VAWCERGRETKGEEMQCRVAEVTEQPDVSYGKRQDLCGLAVWKRGDGKSLREGSGLKLN